jgi:hypothetical protein
MTVAERGLHRGRDESRSNWSGVAYNSGRTDHLDPMEEGDLTPDWDEVSLSLDNMNEREEDDVRRGLGGGLGDEEMGDDAGLAEEHENLRAELDEYEHSAAQQISSPKELAPQSTKLNQIQSPVVNTGENVSGDQVKIDTAGASGIFSDQVLTGSPAQEYGAQGRYTLDGMIEASDRIAREKYRATHGDDK